MALDERVEALEKCGRRAAPRGATSDFVDRMFSERGPDGPVVCEVEMVHDPIVSRDC